MIIHKEASPLKGQTVKLRDDFEHLQFPDLAGKEVIVEDWHDRLAGKSWGMCDGNPACIIYAIRTGMLKNYKVPHDDEVLYVHDKQGGYGHLIHILEIVKE